MFNTIHQNTSHLEHNLNYISSFDAENNSTIHHIESTELQSAIEKALLVIPPQCRKVFEMSRFEQLSYSEIGSQLNISTNTVENHISKALKLLRSELKDFLPFWLLFQLLK